MENKTSSKPDFDIDEISLYLHNQFQKKLINY